MIRYGTVESPIGEVRFATEDEQMIALGIEGGEVDRYRAAAPEPATSRISRALRAYFDGDVAAIDSLPVETGGSDFFRAAWKVMREVPPGETISYAELAARAGNDRAVRAAGSACARNPVALVVPCHRIVRTGGALGNYGFGLDRKAWLLDFERRNRV